jgi:hypothetical protein
VHSFVAGLQLLAPQWVSAVASVHCTQVPPSQTFSPVPAHCVEASHATHVFEVVSHLAAAGSVQSSSAKQATHVLVAVSHSGVSPEQSPESKQPTHMLASVSQTGVPTEQSPAPRHSTQVPEASSHTSSPQSIPHGPRSGGIVRSARSGMSRGMNMSSGTPMSQNTWVGSVMQDVTHAGSSGCSKQSM